jgi:hypothetical protein
MYKRRLKQDGTMSRAAAADEWEVIHDIAHYYTCRSSVDDTVKELAHYYREQEKRLSLVLMDYNSHLYGTAIKEYLKDYPTVFKIN